MRPITKLKIKDRGDRELNRAARNTAVNANTSYNVIFLICCLILFNGTGTHLLVFVLVGFLEILIPPHSETIPLMLLLAAPLAAAAILRDLFLF